jgi:hypothetical protein
VGTSCQRVCAQRWSVGSLSTAADASAVSVPVTPVAA